MPLDEILSNHIFQSVFLSYIISGLLKVIFNYLGTNKIELKMFFRTGGMPSSHTASVAAMTTSIFLLEKVSNLFIVSLIMSIVVISDAIGVRRAAGKQARILNDLIDEFQFHGKLKTKKLYELLGHTPKQVIGGILLGFFLALLVARF
jgi:acid phosphatase family membrane protein YuiD